MSCLGYSAEVLAPGTDGVGRLVAELGAGHSNGKLQHQANDGVYT